MSVTSFISLFLALVLLWFPRNWMRFGKRVSPKPPRLINQAKVERDPYDRMPKPVAEAGKPRNWVDLFRAAVGGYAIFLLAEDRMKAEDHAINGWVLTVAGALWAVGAIIQMIRLEGRLSLFAPIFYLQGLVLGVAGGTIGFIAMFGSWALSPVLPSAGALLFVQGAVTLCLSLLIKGSDGLLGGVLAGVIWLPAIVSLLLQKRLTASFDKKLKVVPRDARED